MTRARRGWNCLRIDVNNQRVEPEAIMAQGITDAQREVGRMFGRDDSEMEQVYAPEKVPSMSVAVGIEEPASGAGDGSDTAESDVITPEARAIIDKLRVLSETDDLDDARKASIEDLLRRLQDAVPSLKAAIDNAKDALNEAPAEEAQPAKA